ncbi:MAG: DUF5694 domain-containing protein [Bacillota bacterium]|jgi:hypothetical protein
MTSNPSTPPTALATLLGITRRAQVLLLGTYHFKFSTNDMLKPKVILDMLSPEKQQEIEEVVELLKRFRPTKIALEDKMGKDASLNADYRPYKDGAFTLTPWEGHQIGFRIASALGHQRVYPIDEWGRQYEPEEKLTEYARKRLGARGADIPDDRLFFTLFDYAVADFERIYRNLEQHMATHSLREHLLYLNSPQQISLGLAVYLAWADAEAGDYTLPDWISGWWYNRNLRIFANLKRITESPEDRILVIFGQGHIPILRHAVENSPKHELVEVSQYL